jgi:hypothetical protein
MTDHPIATKTKLFITLQNNLQTDIIISDITLNRTTSENIVAVGKDNLNYKELPATIQKGKAFKIRSRRNFGKNTRIKENVVITYKDFETGIVSKKEGMVMTRIQ